jgi:signal transduction histidine kinase
MFAEDQKPQAQNLVKEAIAFAKKHGKQALIKEVNQSSGRFHVKGVDEHYIFIYDLTGTCLAIGYQGQLVGVNRIHVKDPDGKPFLQEIIQTAKAKGSGWVDYKYPNPRTSRIEQKTSFVELFEDVVIGCGVYK